MMKNGAAYKFLYILIFFYFIVNCFKLALFNEIVSEILGYGVVIALFAVESKTDFSFIGKLAEAGHPVNRIYKRSVPAE